MSKRKKPVTYCYIFTVLAFLSDRSGTYQVWTLNTTTGHLKQVSFFKDNESISSSNSLSWIDQGQSLALLLSNSEGERKLVSDALNYYSIQPFAEWEWSALKKYSGGFFSPFRMRIFFL